MHMQIIYSSVSHNPNMDGQLYIFLTMKSDGILISYIRVLGETKINKSESESCLMV